MNIHFGRDLPGGKAANPPRRHNRQPQDQPGKQIPDSEIITDLVALGKQMEEEIDTPTREKLIHALATRNDRTLRNYLILRKHSDCLQLIRDFLQRRHQENAKI